MSERQLTDKELRDGVIELLERGMPSGMSGDPEDWRPTGFYLLMEYRTIEGAAAITAIAGHPDSAMLAPWTVEGWVSYALRHGMTGVAPIEEGVLGDGSIDPDDPDDLGEGYDDPEFRLGRD